MTPLFVPTRKLPGDVELIGNGTRREMHRYAGTAPIRRPQLTRADRIARFLEKARGHSTL
jgi:hypothetical protein